MTLAFAVIRALVACSSCREITPPSDDTDTDSPADSAVDSDSDTDVEPPHCAVVGAEPDAQNAPTVLPLEALGCGEFAVPLDADWWSLTLDQQDWVEIRVDARSLGSRADPALVVYRDGLPWASVRDRPDSEDVDLVVPGVAGEFVLFVNEETLSGGPDEFRYELLASSTKPPVDSWDADDTEPNNTIAQAQALPSADVATALGRSDIDRDVDTWKIDAPSGHRSTYDIRVIASESGSPGDFRVDVVDGTGAVRASASVGPNGSSRDPSVSVDSLGDESLYISVRDELGSHGAAYWYVLQVSRTLQ